MALHWQTAIYGIYVGYFNFLRLVCACSTKAVSHFAPPSCSRGMKTSEVVGRIESFGVRAQWFFYQK